jgi:hypothetical protein
VVGVGSTDSVGPTDGVGAAGCSVDGEGSTEGSAEGDAAGSTDGEAPASVDGETEGCEAEAPVWAEGDTEADAAGAPPAADVVDEEHAAREAARSAPATAAVHVRATFGDNLFTGLSFERSNRLADTTRAGVLGFPVSASSVASEHRLGKQAGPVTLAPARTVLARSEAGGRNSSAATPVTFRFAIVGWPR